MSAEETGEEFDVMTLAVSNARWMAQYLQAQARIDKALDWHTVYIEEDGDECATCNEDWPCSTVRALTEDDTA